MKNASVKNYKDLILSEETPRYAVFGFSEKEGYKGEIKFKSKKTNNGMTYIFESISLRFNPNDKKNNFTALKTGECQITLKINQKSVSNKDETIDFEEYESPKFVISQEKIYFFKIDNNSLTLTFNSSKIYEDPWTFNCDYTISQPMRSQIKAELKSDYKANGTTYCAQYSLSIHQCPTDKYDETVEYDGWPFITTISSTGTNQIKYYEDIFLEKEKYYSIGGGNNLKFSYSSGIQFIKKISTEVDDYIFKVVADQATIKFSATYSV